eukprot:4481370-Prorocentrum_lima.AAC.1
MRDDNTFTVSVHTITLEGREPAFSATWRELVEKMQDMESDAGPGTTVLKLHTEDGDYPVA